MQNHERAEMLGRFLGTAERALGHAKTECVVAARQLIQNVRQPSLGTATATRALAYSMMGVKNLECADIILRNWRNSATPKRRRRRA